MKKRINKFVFICLFVACMSFLKNVYAAAINISGESSTSPSSTINVSIGGSFTGRVDVTVSNGSGNKSIWIENSTVTIPVTVGSSGTTTISAVVQKGASDSSGNLFLNADGSLPSASKSISIVVPTPAPTPTTTPNTNNNGNSNSNGNNTSNNGGSSANNGTTTKSSNNYLSKLQVNVEGLSPNFSRTKTNYTLNVGNNISKINVTAVAEDSNSKVYISGNTDLKVGDNNVYITVTAQNGAKRTYSIIVTKSANLDDANSYLESLIIENAKISPEFSKEIFEYDCGTVGSDISSLKILAFPEIEEAKVEISGNDELIEGENEIVVKVTSKDGTTSKDYKIKVLREAAIIKDEDSMKNAEDQDTNVNIPNKSGGFVTFFKSIWYSIKANALIVIMYILIIVEFIEILYLYCKLHDINLFKKKEVVRSKYNVDISGLEKEKEKKEELFKVFKNENNEKDAKKDDSMSRKRNGREADDNNDK